MRRNQGSGRRGRWSLRETGGPFRQAVCPHYQRHTILRQQPRHRAAPVRYISRASPACSTRLTTDPQPHPLPTTLSAAMDQIKKVSLSAIPRHRSPIHRLAHLFSPAYHGTHAVGAPRGSAQANMMLYTAHGGSPRRGGREQCTRRGPQGQVEAARVRNHTEGAGDHVPDAQELSA